MNHYSFKPYDQIFTQLFGDEKNLLKRELGSGWKIEHIGSTAVPGLGGERGNRHVYHRSGKIIAFHLGKTSGAGLCV